MSPITTPALSSSQSHVVAVMIAIVALLSPSGAVGADTAEPPSPVVVSENRAALHLSAPLGLTIFSSFSRQKETCTDFRVSARKDVLPDVLVTSTGFGSASLSDPAKPETRASALPLKNLTSAGSRLQLCLPTELVPNAGDSIEGKILVLVPDRKPVEVPLKLDRPSSDPPSSALLWFLALIIPAFLTYWIARLTAYRTQRGRQLGRFVRYRDLAYLDLRDFFRTHYATLYKAAADDQQFALDLERALREQRIWSHIPDKERGRLIKCLRDARRAETRRLLARQFPDWKRDIENPEK